jgi:hypothetical protein
VIIVCISCVYDSQSVPSGQQCPVNSDNTLLRKPFQRSGKNEISRAFSLFETGDSEFRSTPAPLYRHDTVVFYVRLKVTVGAGLLPERVDLWFTTFFNHLRKAYRFNFEELHSRMVRPIRGPQPNKKSPPENYGKEDQTTVAAFLPWRGL